MHRMNKIISTVVLICFLFNTAVQDLAFGLATPLQSSDIVGIQHKDMGRIKLALEEQLIALDRAYNFSGIDAGALQTMLEHLGKPNATEKTIFQPADMQFFWGDPRGVAGKNLCYMVRVKDKNGLRTYYFRFSIQKDQNNGFPIEVYTEEQYNASAGLAKGAPKIKPEDAKAVDRYMQHEKGIDRLIALAYKYDCVARPIKDRFDYEGEVKKLTDDLNISITNPDPSNIKDIGKRDFALINMSLLEDILAREGVMTINKARALLKTTVIANNDGQAKEVEVDCGVHLSNNAMHAFVYTSGRFHGLTDSSYNGRGMEIAIDVLRREVAHEIGVAADQEIVEMRGKLPFNIIDKRRESYIVPGGKKPAYTLRLTLVDLDKNLVTRDYAARMTNDERRMTTKAASRTQPDPSTSLRAGKSPQEAITATPVGKKAGPTASGGEKATIEEIKAWMGAGEAGFSHVLAALKLMAVQDSFDKTIVQAVVGHKNYRQFAEFFVKKQTEAGHSAEMSIFIFIAAELINALPDSEWTKILKAATPSIQPAKMPAATVSAMSTTKGPKATFKVGGVNDSAVIRALTSLNGLTIKELNQRLKPSGAIASSLEGFIGKNEDLVSVLITDNDFVIRAGFTHQQLAEPLLLAADTQKPGKFEFQNIQYTVDWAPEASRGLQASPFNDRVAGGGIMVIKRLTDSQEIKCSPLTAEYIKRYGFYQGKGTNFRTEPAQIIAMFFAQPSVPAGASASSLANASNTLRIRGIDVAIDTAAINSALGINPRFNSETRALGMKFIEGTTDVDAINAFIKNKSFECYLPGVVRVMDRNYKFVYVAVLNYYDQLTPVIFAKRDENDMTTVGIITNVSRKMTDMIRTEPVFVDLAVDEIWNRIGEKASTPAPTAAVPAPVVIFAVSNAIEKATDAHFPTSSHSGWREGLRLKSKSGGVQPAAATTAAPTAAATPATTTRAAAPQATITGSEAIREIREEIDRVMRAHEQRLEQLKTDREGAIADTMISAMDLPVHVDRFDKNLEKITPNEIYVLRQILSDLKAISESLGKASLRASLTANFIDYYTRATESRIVELEKGQATPVAVTAPVAPPANSVLSLEDIMTLVPSDWLSFMNLNKFAQAVKDAGFTPEMIAEDGKSAVIFSTIAAFGERVGDKYEEGIGPILPDLVKCGMRIAVVTQNTEQDEFIKGLNKGIPIENEIKFGRNIADIKAELPAPRYYYLKVDHESAESGVTNITIIVKKILDAIGNVLGISIDAQERRNMHKAAEALAVAA